MAFAEDKCDFLPELGNDFVKSQSIALGQVAELAVPFGFSKVKVSCQTSKQSVLTFSRRELKHISWSQVSLNPVPLVASSPSFLIPIGDFQANLSVQTHHKTLPHFKFLSIQDYVALSQRHTLIMGCFYGLCLGLMLYVVIIGRSLKDYRFRLYGLYTGCAGMFFLLQEGHLNLFVANNTLLNSHQVHLIFAGLTALSAVVFITNLLELDKRWPRYAQYVLFYPACVIFVIPFILLLVANPDLSETLEMVMAWGSLLVVTGVFVISAYAACRKVHSATLVFAALSVVFLAMVFRIGVTDVSPFLHRYALFFAFALQSFLLAIATSEMIKMINQGRLLAEAEAINDPLCEILNRRGWQKKAELLLHLHSAKSGYLCLLYIDLNDFKYINDQHGHQTGDEVLKVFAKIVRNQARDSDAVGRLGGDEFVALAYFSSHRKCEMMIQRIASRLEGLNVHTSSGIINTSASVGSVIFTSPPANISELLKQGDAAMYTKKHLYHESLHGA